MSNSLDYYNSTYKNFGLSLTDQIRREVYGEDIGQNSWLTADEYRQHFQWLNLNANSHVLEVASGSGGQLIVEAGFELLKNEDVTENMARIAGRWHAAREQRRADLIQIEGEATFQGTQRLFTVSHRIASERRLSRFVFLAHKP